MMDDSNDQIDEEMLAASSSSHLNNFSDIYRPSRSGTVVENVKRKLTIKNFKAKHATPANVTFQKGTNGSTGVPTGEWAIISENIQAILAGKKTDTSLETLFKLIKLSCDKTHPKELYERLLACVLEYCEKLRQGLTSYDDIPLSDDTCEVYLTRYWKIWRDYPVKMSLIRNVFLHLDRMILLFTNETEIMPIWESTMVVFRKVFFPEIGREFKNIRLFSALFMNLQRMMKRFNTDGNAFRELLSMLSTIHVNEEFMDFFISQLREFYTKKRTEMMPNMSCDKYMKYANLQIESYEEIVTKYFCEPTALKVVSKTVLECLVAAALPDILDHGFDELLESTEMDVKIMFLLCKRCLGGEDYVRVQFNKYIRAKGQKMMDSCEDDDLFQELLSFKKKMDTVVSKGFEGSVDNTKFKQALCDSFESFMNTRGNRAAELIAKYFHVLLRMCNKKATDESLDEMIDDAIVVFRFIRGKDVFEAFYKRDLAKRLLLDRSASVDAEKTVLTKLKMECGAGFTHKLEGMFKDMETSEDLNRMFHQYLEHENKEKANVNIRVLTTDHWPKYELYEINLPKEMRENLIDFGSFYKQQHGNRTVSWHYALSTAVVSAKFRPGYSKELILSLYHAVVLLLFNKCDKWTFKEITDATGIQKVEVIRTILALVGGRGKPRILQKVTGNGTVVCSPCKAPGTTARETAASSQPTVDSIENDTFMVNTAFQEKLYRIRIAQVQLKTTKEEKEQVEQEVNQDRQYQIDAAVVRIMKSRKELMHAQLIQEIMAQLKFPVKSTDIKSRIESLIERDYIARDGDEPNKYKYVS